MTKRADNPGARGPLLPSGMQVVPDSRTHLSRKLRVSLTSSCNLRCFFCHNEGQGSLTRNQRHTIAIDEYKRIIQNAVRAGIREVKLTGGEPMLYRDQTRTVVDLVRELRDIDSQEHFGLSLTTNGTLLSKHARELHTAGLDRVTVSLHTLDAQKFNLLIAPRSSARMLPNTIEGIQSAVAAGLTPVKVNTVIFDDGAPTTSNIDELATIVKLCRSLGVAQLRLYTLLNHDLFVDHARWYRFWDDQLLETVGTAITPDSRHAAAFKESTAKFLNESRSQVYPRPRLLVSSQGMEVAIEAMESGQFAEIGLPDEGPYALRLTAEGELHGLISDTNTRPNLIESVRNGASDNDIELYFRSAIESALPAEESEDVNQP